MIYNILKVSLICILFQFCYSRIDVENDQVVNEHISVVDESDELELHDSAPSQDDSIQQTQNTGIPVFRNLPDCSKKSKERVPIVLVSTIDSHITAINYLTGRILWSHETGVPGSPLLSSSMSNVEVTTNEGMVRLIPSLKGDIYKFNGDAVEALPFNADSLLQSSFKFNDDTVITGGKFSDILGILPNTGAVKYRCDSQGCPVTNSNQDVNSVLVVRRVSHTVRAIDPKTGNERWNFSVGQHEVNVANSGCDSSFHVTNEESLPSIHFVLPEGLVVAVDDRMQVVWKQKLPSPIVSAWSLVNGQLNTINLFSSVSVPALLRQEADAGDSCDKGANPDAALYVGVHQKQLYILLNDNIVNSKDGLGYIDNGKQITGSGLLKLQWEPFSALANRRTRVLALDNGRDPSPALIESGQTNELAVAPDFDYSFDNGFFLYGDEDAAIFNASSGNFDGLYDDMNFPDQIYYYCITVGPTLWWTLFAGVVLYCFLHVLVFRYLFRIVLNDVERDMNRRITAVVRILLHNILREHPQILNVIQRLGLNIPPLPPPVPPSRENSSDSSVFGNGLDRSQSKFTSRYVTDFEPIRCLGRGGFGVVFHAKNRLDENEYAVKRISIPSKESSAERVKREVRALAKLSHPNIVRYYNSWLETPPLGWEQEADAWWKTNATLSGSPLSLEDGENESTSVSKCPRPVVESLSGVVNKLNQNPMLPGPNFSYVSDISVTRDVEESDGNESDCEDSAYDCTKDSFEVVFGPVSGVEDQSVVFEESNGSDCRQESLLRPENVNQFPRTKSSSFSINECNFKSNRKQRTLSLQESSNQIARPSSLLLEDSEAQHIHSLGVKKWNKESKISDADQSTVAIPKTYLYIQMELCHKESLRDWLFNNPVRDSSHVYLLFNDIVNAVEYVHDRALMHRDLKPSNIFFSLEGEIKIGDFGLVTSIEEENYALTPMVDSTSKSICKAGLHQRTLNAGTHLYMSPEQMRGQQYTYKVDIYSLGLILFEMLVPFTTEMERRKVMLIAREKTFPEGFENTFPDVEKLLQLALHQSPSERPTTRGIRSRLPLAPLQKDLDSITSEEHFKLIKTKGHARTLSGSFSGGVSSSTAS